MTTTSEHQKELMKAHCSAAYGISIDPHCAARLAAAARDLGVVLDREDARQKDVKSRLDDEPSAFDDVVHALATPERAR